MNLPANSNWIARRFIKTSGGHQINEGGKVQINYTFEGGVGEWVNLKVIGSPISINLRRDFFIWNFEALPAIPAKMNNDIKDDGTIIYGVDPAGAKDTTVTVNAGGRRNGKTTLEQLKREIQEFAGMVNSEPKAGERWRGVATNFRAEVVEVCPPLIKVKFEGDPQNKIGAMDLNYFKRHYVRVPDAAPVQHVQPAKDDKPGIDEQEKFKEYFTKQKRLRP